MEQRATALAAVVNDLWSLHQPFLGAESSLPSWLGDQLVNSLSHIRTAMWFQNCSHCHRSKDARLDGAGFWRQWESYACDDLDSIHNDGERHIPYLMFFPNTTRSKLAAWAGNQQPDGMLNSLAATQPPTLANKWVVCWQNRLLTGPRPIGLDAKPHPNSNPGMLAEQILNKDPDTAQGRRMVDSSSMFMVYLLELLNWDGDLTSLQLYWPTVKGIVQWHIAQTEKLGVPYKLETTYDQLGFPKYDASSYATAFHLLAMRVCQDLAIAMADTKTQVSSHRPHAYACTCRSTMHSSRCTCIHAHTKRWSHSMHDAGVTQSVCSISCLADLLHWLADVSYLL